MSSGQFQAAHDSIYVTGRLLLQYLQEIRAGRRSQGDDTKGLQSVEDDMITALNALKNQKYQVAVIAAMKAGKSTFLNAVIGADVLASEAEACTVCRTDIRHIDAGQVPRLLEYRQGKTHPDTIAEGNAGEIRQKFLERTHEIRDRANSDKTTHFELLHPIEAISTLSSLAGFTLVDTPGPNEWKSARFNTIALKQTALEALRTCDAILFILDYTSFKDNTNSELLENLIEQRQEFLAENTGKIYFILNKVDRKSERDRDITDVITDLSCNLIDFGIPEPTIYPVSAWQGLLAKLIQQGAATDSQKKDFRKFFSAPYAVEDEEGGSYTPPLSQIAPQALKDSFIPTVEETVIQTIFQNSGWNLLSDALRKIDNAAKAIENTLNTDIRGWEKKLEELKQIVGEYKMRSQIAKSKVEDVKKSVDERKQELVSEFKRKMSDFSERAKLSIENEFEQFASSRASESRSSNRPNFIPIEDGELLLSTSFRRLFSIPFHLFESLRQLISDQTNDPYKIRVDTQRKAEQFKQAINDFCVPLVKRWWL